MSSTRCVTWGAQDRPGLEGLHQETLRGTEDCEAAIGSKREDNTSSLCSPTYKKGTHRTTPAGLVLPNDLKSMTSNRKKPRTE